MDFIEYFIISGLYCLRRQGFVSYSYEMEWFQITVSFLLISGRKTTYKTCIIQKKSVQRKYQAQNND